MPKTSSSTESVIHQVRRERIIEAAVTCLVRDGWHGATLAEIAKEAGISRGLISYHFDGRDDLHVAVLESVAATIFAAGASEMQAPIDAARTAEAKLRAYIAGNLLFIAAHRREMTALRELMPNLRTPDGRPRFDPASEEPILAGTALLFDFGVSTGEFRAGDSRLLAFTLRRCIDAAATQISIDPEFDLVAYGDELTDLFLKGIRS
jgi:TetR/AcrR family transcriptional regulator, fatty acid metabolism regulator protein